MSTSTMFFHNLFQLAKHLPKLSPLLDKQGIFIVGGAVRDILLGLTLDPTDIDVTLAANPEQLRATIEKKNSDMSIFRTDKYGTITLINKGTITYEYEITPFRTEGAYTDVRHPDDIQRSDSLLADSHRRDFTSNCLYRYGRTTDSAPKSNPTLLKNKEQLLTLLKKKENIYLADSKTLIIQDYHTITSLYPVGILDLDKATEILHQAHVVNLGEEQQNTSHISILIDPHGGLQDLMTRIIRTVGNPDDRFQEDALRILRGVRFPNILNQLLPDRKKQNTGFIFEKGTWASMQTHAHLVKSLASERIHQELVKVFTGNNPFGYIALLDELGLIEPLFPALAKCKSNTQPTLYHPFDTYTHTLLTLENLQKINSHYLAKLAMLYHDVGKPDQYAYISEQKTKDPDNIDMSDYMHHTETGAKIAKEDFKQLGFSKKEMDEIAWYIRWHHRPGEILDSNEKNQTKKLRKLLSEGGLQQTFNLIDIAIADRSGQYNPLQLPAVEELYDMKKTIQQLHDEEGRFTMKELAIDGTTIMKELHIAAGPELGKLLAKAFDRVLGDVPTRNTKQKILVHLKSL